MQQQQQDREMEFFAGGKRLLNIAAFVCHAISTSVEVFIRTDIGTRYLNWQALAALPIMLAFGSFFPGQDVRPMFYYIVAYLVFCGRARLEQVINRWRGKPLGHSYYSGRPRALNCFRSWKERTVKLFVEPPYIFVVGGLAYFLFPSVGAYLMIASVAMFITQTLADMYQQARAMDMHDSVVAQQSVVERFQDMQK